MADRLNLVGADPELLIRDVLANDIIPVTGLVGGSKDNPLKLDVGVFDKGYFVQEDNVAVEFNIPACHSSPSFVAAINKAIGAVKKLLPDNIELVTDKVSHMFRPEQLTDPAVCRFGCDRDFNPYIMELNPKPDCKSNLRCVGGHLHINYRRPSIEDNAKLAIACDLFAGVPAVLVDKDKDRRKMYGQAGSYREKSYGIEYRSLSSFWVTSDGRIKWAFEAVERAVDELSLIDDMSDKEKFLIQYAINNHDESIAEKFVKKYSMAVPT